MFLEQECGYSRPARSSLALKLISGFKLKAVPPHAAPVSIPIDASVYECHSLRPFPTINPV